ncbi:type VI secretion system tip protein VgrG [Edwardsiella ictaluri]|uniref:Type VI secretion system Vgr family protein n=2 Tax=Edwardsiella ictaluri TaxID=67780 RepID=C5BAE3_EDWI9|nr:type VI secretion system tip protein VgrG [Edwardsiella ictaluri]ACR69913.1 type VI secretion system Vgr family protein [Edwardsiella ictaluri 93-146]ARD38950.1 type VI secretion protein [Edwardsiella ictaluri]AVZ83154.1 type VI secretion system tip protein VgrG [Edwardsiella ictaluri]EKS7764223.1 type VI secretion system tip protein VgrG [Edwardsiella ictaluri]EKS7771082.1 type VI secretion system tip protein VgrG [Edwardsiella ictaluri]
MELTSDNRLLSLSTPLGKNTLQVVQCRGEESVSDLYRFELELFSTEPTLEWQKLVGQAAALRLALPDGQTRYWHGVIGQASYRGAEQHGYAYYAELVPHLAWLQHAQECQIFQEKTVPQIIETVLKARGISDFRLSLSQHYAPREYCVQYRESDLSFISRLMEEEGIFYWFDHSESHHVMVLADSNAAVQPCKTHSDIVYRPKHMSESGDDIQLWMPSLSVVPANVFLNTYTFEQPTASLLTSTASVARQGKLSDVAVYDFTDGYTQTREGERRAKLRMEGLEAMQARIEGGGRCRTLAPGYWFSLQKHFRKDCNDDYLLLSVRHEIVNNLPWQNQEVNYQNHFVCLPKSLPYRPLSQAPRPVIHGVQTAVVTGPQGEEIHTDLYGRVKVHFHWDRLGKQDDKSSCWIRVAQGWAGLGWGGMQLPRVGQEVIVDFIDGNPDAPLITGRVYNANQTPPFKLPDNKTQSGIQTRSTPNGNAEHFSLLRFEDKMGAEEVFMQSARDFRRLVKHDDELTVEHDRRVTIKNDCSETVSEGNYLQSITKGKHTRMIEGDTLTEVKSGNSTLQVDRGDHATRVSAGSLHLEAGTSITLSVGSNRIVIDSSGVLIEGMDITVKGKQSIDASGLSVAIKGTQSASLSSSAEVEVSSSVMTSIKGGIVKIN